MAGRPVATALGTVLVLSARTSTRQINSFSIRDSGPLLVFKAAACAFSDPQHIEDFGFEWIEVSSRKRLRPGMFVAQVVGKSMEPAIPDGGLMRLPRAS
jgi:phage repressor protein C with HTH and peptisase S24 domain